MPLFDVFMSMLWFFLWVAWIWIAISVFADIFRSSDLSGVAKAVWAIVVLLVPFIGVFVYLIARGDAMQQRAVDQATRQQQAAESYIRSVAASGNGSTEELAKLGRLRDEGVLTEEEFATQKAKILS